MGEQKGQKSNNEQQGKTGQKRNNGEPQGKTGTEGRMQKGTTGKVLFDYIIKEIDREK